MRCFFFTAPEANVACLAQPRAAGHWDRDHTPVPTTCRMQQHAARAWLSTSVLWGRRNHPWPQEQTWGGHPGLAPSDSIFALPVFTCTKLFSYNNFCCDDNEANCDKRIKKGVSHLTSELTDLKAWAKIKLDSLSVLESDNENIRFLLQFQISNSSNRIVLSSGKVFDQVCIVQLINVCWFFFFFFQICTLLNLFMANNLLGTSDFHDKMPRRHKFYFFKLAKSAVPHMMLRSTRLCIWY